ncbi:MAG: ABC transporter permease [Chloroflexi bacterium]|nr:ABC transporter permease [Chloroflexota bacterium]
MQTLLIARLTLKEAARKKLLLLTVVGGGLFLVLFGVGLAVLLPELRAQFAREGRPTAQAALFVSLMTIMGFYVLNFLAGISAMFVSVNAISGETDSGTVHALLAHPLRRRDIVLGKWLGYAAVLILYVVTMSGSLLAIVYFVGGYRVATPLPAVALMVLVTLVVLSLSFFGGTFLPTLANGIGIFLLYGLAWMGGLIEIIGAQLHSDAMNYIGIVVSLLMPSDILWRGASYYLQPAWVVLLENSQNVSAAPFASSTPPTTAMIVYAGLYTVIALGAAVAVFNRRDL